MPKSKHDAPWTEVEKMNARISSILESMMDAFIELDPEFRYTYVNRGAEQILEVQREAVLGQYIGDVLPNVEGSLLENEFRRSMLEQTQVSFEMRGVTEGNKEKWYIVHAYPSSEGLSIYLRDITKQKRSEQMQLRINKALESTGEAIGITDAKGKSVYYNQAFIDLFGYQVEESNVMGGPFVHYANSEVAREVFDTISRGQSWNGPVEVCAKNGEQITVFLRADAIKDDEGAIVGLVGIHTDMRLRLQAEKELRLSEERFMKAFNAGPSMISITRLSDGKYVEVNEHFLRITGYQRQEVLGHTEKELGLWLNFEGEKLRDILLVKGNVRNWEIEVKIMGGQITGLLSSEVIDFGGEPCALTVVQDITERKKLDKEIARLDRLNLIGEMAAGIAHEIRNPMTTVSGFLQLLSTKTDCAEYQDYFHLMNDELERANSIITEYLALAKNKAIALEKKNLNIIVKALCPLIAADAIINDKYIKVDLHEIPDLLIDEKEIRQLLLNLTRNGLEAMQPGGILTITTAMKGNDVILGIHDQGGGISPQALEKIGTPFFTTKDQGTGLGLAVCYSIASRHKAKITVETGPRGSLFQVHFKPQMG